MLIKEKSDTAFVAPFFSRDLAILFGEKVDLAISLIGRRVTAKCAANRSFTLSNSLSLHSSCKSESNSFSRAPIGPFRAF